MWVYRIGRKYRQGDRLICPKCGRRLIRPGVELFCLLTYSRQSKFHLGVKASINVRNIIAPIEIPT